MELPNEIFLIIAQLLDDNDKVILCSVNNYWLNFGITNITIKTPCDYKTIVQSRWSFESLVINDGDDFDLYKSLTVTQAFDRRTIKDSYYNFCENGIKVDTVIPWHKLPTITTLTLEWFMTFNYDSVEDFNHSMTVRELPNNIRKLVIDTQTDFRFKGDSPDYNGGIVIITLTNNFESNGCSIHINSLDHLVVKNRLISLDIITPIKHIQSVADICFPSITNTCETLHIRKPFRRLGLADIIFKNLISYITTLTDFNGYEVYYPSLQKMMLIHNSRLMPVNLNYKKTPRLKTIYTCSISKGKEYTEFYNNAKMTYPDIKFINLGIVVYDSFIEFCDKHKHLLL